MNIKSFVTLGLAVVALAVTSIAPAEAHNNNNSKLLNAEAMQMYMQNQALAGNASAYNPALLANYAGYRSPWANTALPAYGSSVSPWANILPVSNVMPVSNVISPYGGCNSAYNNGILMATMLLTATLYRRSTMYSPNKFIANLQAQLAANNLNAWQAARLQNKLSQLQRQENRVASTGYGSPYAHRSNILNNLRSSMRI